MINAVLLEFKNELLKDIQVLLDNNNSLNYQKKYLRSSDVMKMLGISASTLQTLRINGSIPAYKLGNTWIYKTEELEQVIVSNKIVNCKNYE